MGNTGLIAREVCCHGRPCSPQPRQAAQHRAKALRSRVRYRDTGGHGIEAAQPAAKSPRPSKAARAPRHRAGHSSPCQATMWSGARKLKPLTSPFMHAHFGGYFSFIQGSAGPKCGAMSLIPLSLWMPRCPLRRPACCWYWPPWAGYGVPPSHPAGNRDSHQYASMAAIASAGLLLWLAYGLIPRLWGAVEADALMLISSGTVAGCRCP